MNRLYVVRAIGFTVVLLSLAGCAMIPSAAPPALDELKEWDVIVIGDSSLWGVAEPYAKLIEQDRGVKVNLHDNWEGALSAKSILKALQGDSGGSMTREKWPQLIPEAEVLVLFGNPVDSLEPETLAVLGKCLSSLDPGDAALDSDAFAPYKADLGAIYEEIAELREGRPLILRATDIYNPLISIWREKGIEDVCGAYWEGQNEALRQAATEHGVPFVSVYDEFNGPKHDQDPRAKGFIREDGEHPSEQGAAIYARMLVDSGFEAVTVK
jgi:hypothetical protein